MQVRNEGDIGQQTARSWGYAQQQDAGHRTYCTMPTHAHRETDGQWLVYNIELDDMEAR